MLQRGLDDTATLGPDVCVPDGGGQRAAPLLPPADPLEATAVQRRLQGLRGVLTRHPAKAGARGLAVDRLLTVSRRDGPELFHGSSVPTLPRTNKALAQFFGAPRKPAWRATGQKGAAPALVLRGTVQLGASAATRRRPCTEEELASEPTHPWQERRQRLETRRQQRTYRRRFRRDPAAYLAKLEADGLQLMLPP
jgi:hypothetical protein